MDVLLGRKEGGLDFYQNIGRQPGSFEFTKVTLVDTSQQVRSASLVRTHAIVPTPTVYTFSVHIVHDGSTSEERVAVTHARNSSTQTPAHYCTHLAFLAQ